MTERDVKTAAELFDLTDRVVVLTGASSGLGAQWAPVLAGAGAHVVMAARRAPELEAVAERTPGGTRSSPTSPATTDTE